MTLASAQNYHTNNVPMLLVVFHLQTPNAVQRLHRERDGWQGNSEIEMLGPDHAVLIIRAGGTRRLAC
jgi:hypothetical protein